MAGILTQCSQKIVNDIENKLCHKKHPASLFVKLGIIDIFQIDSFQMSKSMFYYHSLLMPSTSFNLFETRCLEHNCGTKVIVQPGEWYIFS